ncbi:MAG: DnaJ domain-containing protein [Cyanobacteria bacterium P01_F01_bin.42]
MLTLPECYRILGLTPDASFQEVRQAYRNLVKRWHPDRQNQARVSSEAQAHFLKIQTAYEQIKKHQQSTSKQSFASEQPSAPPTSSSSHAKTSATVGKTPKAEVLYANASELGRQGLYKDAIAELSRAIRVDPSYARAYEYRGHLRSLLGLERQAEADLNKAQVLKAIGTDAPRSAADVEAIAREYGSSRRRSASRFSRRYRRGSGSKNWMLWSLLGLGVATGAAAMVGLLPFNGPRDPVPRPLRFESPAVES